jgi:flagellar biosynthetic protein FlhB
VKSREVTSVAVLVAGVVYFSFFAGQMGTTLMKLTRFFFTEAAIRDDSPENLFRIFLEAAQGVGWAIMPLLLTVVIFSLSSQIFQFGFLFSPKAMKPKFNKLNPLEGAKRLLGKQGWMDLFKSLAKVALVGYVGYITIVEVWAYLPNFSQMDPLEFLTEFTSIALKIAIRCAAILIFLAALDYAFQRYSHEQSIKMTKEEVKQEYKQREGDPQVKGRIRQVQREISRKRMMSAIPEADVVITNPTHFAVAIQYNRAEMEAPVLVAKGRGFIAQKVREIAKENDVPIVENKPLARGLYKAVQVGQAIPAEFYKAVAEVLAYVYTLKNKAA